MTYIEKLKDPRWQKKRLEILSRDKFACQQCFDKESTLNVHHKYYLKNRDPWDYEDNCFVTLCEYCHGYEHSQREVCDKELIMALRQIGCTFIDIRFLTQAIINMKIDCLNKISVNFLTEDQIFKHSCPSIDEIDGLLV